METKEAKKKQQKGTKGVKRKAESDIKQPDAAIKKAKQQVKEKKDIPLGDHPMKICYFSNSKDVTAGKGAKEEVSSDAKYKDTVLEIQAALKKIPDWRKKLSAMYVCTNLTFDPRTGAYVSGGILFHDKHFASQEHIHHYLKFHKSHPSHAADYTLESNSVICKDPFRAKAAGGKGGIVKAHISQDSDAKKKKGEKKEKKTRDKTVIYVRSSGAWNPNDLKEGIYDMLFARFTQVRECRDALLATGKLMWNIEQPLNFVLIGNALLTHNPGRFSQTVVENLYMQVREDIRKQVDTELL